MPRWLFIILAGIFFLQPVNLAAQSNHLNTAANAAYLNEFEKQVILELNNWNCYRKAS